MNDNCWRECAYKDLCNLSKENTDICKVADDKQAQDIRKETLFGYKTEDLLKKQYK